MYHIIINPSSKSGRGIHIWNDLEPVLKRKHIQYKVLYSEYAGHIIKLVNELNSSDEHIRLIVVGGDGTMNEVLQGIVNWAKISIGYIPTGSSNDFARAQGYAKTPVEQLNAILACKEGSERLLDIGLLTYLDAVDEDGHPVTITRRFDVSCGIGFDAAVCAEAMNGTSGFKNRLNKLGLGKLTYLSIALKHLLVNTGVSVKYTIDDKPSVSLEQFLFIAAMQNPYEGGGFKFCPAADPTDGLLDLCIISVKSKAKILAAIPLAFSGKHLIFKGIECVRASKVHIQTSGALWIHTDGEVHRKSRDFTVESLPAKLKFLI